MNRMLIPLALLLSVPSFAEKDAGKIDSLAWMAGKWSGPMWGGEFVATYGAPAGGKLISFSELLKEGHAAFYEFEVFEATDQGLVFTPYPGGRRKETFKLASSDAAKAVFENPDKDFPQRVGYESPDDATLIGRIEGQHEGRDRRIEFPMKRTACPTR